MKVLTVFVIYTILCTAVLGFSIKSLMKNEWNEFKLKYEKQYDTLPEEEYRFKVYVENREVIAKHNERFAMGLETYDMAVNHFTDLTHKEFVEQFTGNMPLTNETLDSYVDDNDSDEVLYDLNDFDYDWRPYMKGRIKDQKSCGSCWAFAVVTLVEHHYWIYKRKFVELSEQQLVDCARGNGNNGCKGGNQYATYSYIKNNGLTSASNYKYTARNGNCRYNRNMQVATIRGYNKVESNAASMEKALEYGPLYVSIHATDDFGNYHSGIFSQSNCPKNTNHAVVIVGHGKRNGHAYWIGQNSWGTRWGEQGYFRMSKGNNNMCGINTNPAYPVV